jgi:hypothetical protein
MNSIAQDAFHDELKKMGMDGMSMQPSIFGATAPMNNGPAAPFQPNMMR